MPSLGAIQDQLGCGGRGRSIPDRRVPGVSSPAFAAVTVILQPRLGTAGSGDKICLVTHETTQRGFDITESCETEKEQINVDTFLDKTFGLTYQKLINPEKQLHSAGCMSYFRIIATLLAFLMLIIPALSQDVVRRKYKNGKK